MVSASSWWLLYSQFMMHGQKNIKLYFVVFDGFISILQLLQNGMENSKNYCKTYYKLLSY